MFNCPDNNNNMNNEDDEAENETEMGNDQPHVSLTCPNLINLT